MTDRPRVSCLMVTKASIDRLLLMMQSIADYCRQTYSQTELVIIFTPPATAARELMAHVEALDRPDIRIVACPASFTLGALRNRSIAEAKGALVCQWDDDDRHHPDRVARQVAAMSAAQRRASFLQDVLHYLAVPHELYWTHWSRTPGGYHPGTMMCDREAGVRYPETGAEANLGEDLAVLLDLERRALVAPLAGAPHLFIYVTHGGNAWPPDHHRMLIDRLALSCALLRRREAAIREGLMAFDFGSENLAVMGSNGPAFVIRHAAGLSS